MNEWVYRAAWGLMASASAFGIAAGQDWISLKGVLTGIGLVAAGLGAALMHPPAEEKPEKADG